MNQLDGYVNESLRAALPRLRGGLIPWPYHWGYGVRKDGLHYRAWKWRGLLITPAKAVR